jgi:hypothetical protein
MFWPGKNKKIRKGDNKLRIRHRGTVKLVFATGNYFRVSVSQWLLNSINILLNGNA